MYRLGIGEYDLHYYHVGTSSWRRAPDIWELDLSVGSQAELAVESLWSQSQEGSNLMYIEIENMVLEFARPPGTDIQESHLTIPATFRKGRSLGVGCRFKLAEPSSSRGGSKRSLSPRRVID